MTVSIDFDTAKANTKAGGYTVADAYRPPRRQG